MLEYHPCWVSTATYLLYSAAVMNNSRYAVLFHPVIPSFIREVYVARTTLSGPLLGRGLVRVSMSMYFLKGRITFCMFSLLTVLKVTG